jgi:hypothetical protein
VTIPVYGPACDPTAECHIPRVVVNVDRADPARLIAHARDDLATGIEMPLACKVALGTEATLGLSAILR